MPLAPIPARSISVVLYNPLLALILALFFGLAVRSFILLYVQRTRGFLATIFRGVEGVAFLALGWLYALFAAPLLVWDRPARATGAVVFLAVPLWTAARSSLSRTMKSPQFRAVLVKLVLFVILLFTATLTIIRTGYLALVGDRVTLLVDVTGETRSETDTLPLSVPPRQESLTLHHVIIWLPSGEKAVDNWFLGDSFAVRGRSIRFSPTLRAIRVPNLYALLDIHNWYSTPERLSTQPAARYWIPSSGSLAVHPWWRPIQNRLLAWWADGVYYPPHLVASTTSGPLKVSTWSQLKAQQVLSGQNENTAPRAWWAIQMSENESPLYPLVNPDGTPTRNRFLLVIQTWGVTTSRGSSPLDARPAVRK